MIQDMCATPATMARLGRETERVFDEYGLSEAERAALRTGDALTMVTQCNVHPILAFHYLFATRPEVTAMMSLSGYPHLMEDAR
jgi:hypothetical protein